MGDRDHHHVGRRAVDHEAADLALSDHCAARGVDQRELSGRIREDRRGFGHPDHRAAHAGPRRAAVHVLLQRSERRCERDAHICQRDGSGHRAGAGPEQAAAGDAVVAADRAAAGCERHQSQQQLSDGRRPGVGRQQHGSHGHLGLRELASGRAAEPRARRGQRAGVRRRVRHAHLARSRQAQHVSAHAFRRHRRDSRSERPGVGRPARCTAFDVGPAAQRHRHGAGPTAEPG